MRTVMSSAHVRTVFPAGNSADLPSSANVTRGIGRRFYVFDGAVRHIRTAHERRGLDMTEAELFRAPAEVRELIGGVVAPDGMMIAGRRQVLSHRKDLDA